MRVNCAWHARHPMPPDARLDQRIEWHLAHQRHCGCRPVPAAIRIALMRRAADDDDRMFARLRRAMSR